MTPEDRQQERSEAAAKLPDNRSSLQPQQHKKPSEWPGSSPPQRLAAAAKLPDDHSSSQAHQLRKPSKWPGSSPPHRLAAAAQLPGDHSSLHAQQHRKLSKQPGSSPQQLKPESSVQLLDLSSLVQQQSWQDKGWQPQALPAQQLLLQDFCQPLEDRVTAADKGPGAAAPAERGKPTAGGQLVASPKTQKKVMFMSSAAGFSVDYDAQISAVAMMHVSLFFAHQNGNQDAIQDL